MPASAAPPDTADARRGTVQSVERALTLLEILGEDPEGCRLTDLAARSALSPSTVHRLLTTLEERRFVQFDPTDGLWHVGRQAFLVGSSFVRHRNVVAQALPFLRQLRDLTRETANLGVIEDGEVVVLTQVESREIMRAITRVGGRVPVLASAMGKAILATYAPEDVAALVTRFGMPRLTEATLTDPAALAAELERTRRRGYAVDDEEFVHGLRCVAAIVRSHAGEPLCAISVSGLSARVSRDRVPQLGNLVARIAGELTTAFGGPPARIE